MIAFCILSLLGGVFMACGVFLGNLVVCGNACVICLSAVFIAQSNDTIWTLRERMQRRRARELELSRLSKRTQAEAARELYEAIDKMFH